MSTADALKQLNQLSPAKRALLAQRLAPPPEPIAIVGIGCRFPGGADTPDAYWRLLCDGVDAVSEVPSERWDVDAFFDPNPDAPGRTNSRWGAFLDEIDRFDPAFFRISPREAQAMDPQQRLLLEIAWNAFEDAGRTQESLAGSQTGVFVGICNLDYYAQNPPAPQQIDVHTGPGSHFDVAAGRLSYFFDLRGPSIAVDTACSSSLVAVHLASESLRSSECETAVAAGVNVLLSPLSAIGMSRMHLMAPDGRCKTFDARADGIVRGEGCGAVVLRRLSDALADGDRIYSVIRGSAINQDGRTAALTAPSVIAQRAVCRRALKRARVSGSQVGYIEAHGTGTALGDPIEIEALSEVYGATGNGAEPCRVGSVKTNFGHLESAAGIAGLIKTSLSLHHGAIPPHLHFSEPNPLISLDDTRLSVPTRLEPWPATENERFAAVSSFGWSGSNAHVVLSEAPPAPEREANGEVVDPVRESQLLPI